MTLLSEKAAGVYVIAVTPFTESGAIDFPSIDRMVDFYIERGVSGLVVLGMMGEAPKLTGDESRAVVQRVLARLAGKVPVVVGVSAPGLASMRELAQGVMADGAAGVMVAPPGALRTDDQIVNYYRTVVETLGEDTPFVLQDFPLATGVQISPAVISRIVAAHPSCVMLKHEDWPGLAKITELRAVSDAGKTRRISIMVGNGGMFLPEEMERGADGAMTGFAFPEMMVDVCKAYAAGDKQRAHDLFDAYLPLARYEMQPGFGLTIRKHILARRGAIASPVLRQPGRRLPAVDAAEVDNLIARQTKRLQELGVE